MIIIKKTIHLFSVFIAFVLVCATIPQCKHQTNFNQLKEVSYSKEINPIITSNCTFSGCHGDIRGEKFNLSTYDGLMSGGISAEHPENSKLYKSLVTLNSEEMMPKKPYNNLTEQQIQLIYIWIGQGAKNN